MKEEKYDFDIVLRKLEEMKEYYDNSSQELETYTQS
jgi:hypothetical protein